MKYKDYEYPKYYEEDEKKYYTDYRKLASDMVKGKFPKVKVGNFELDNVYFFPTDPRNVKSELEEAYYHEGEADEPFDFNDKHILEESISEWCSMKKESGDYITLVEDAIISDCSDDDGNVDQSCYEDLRSAFFDGCEDSIKGIVIEIQDENDGVKLLDEYLKLSRKENIASKLSEKRKSIEKRIQHLTKKLHNTEDRMELIINKLDKAETDKDKKELQFTINHLYKVRSDVENTIFDLDEELKEIL